MAEPRTRRSPCRSIRTIGTALPDDARVVCDGYAFAVFALSRGATVLEVPGPYTKRHRRHASRRGKSDANDAQAIAEVVLREPGRLPHRQSCTTDSVPWPSRRQTGGRTWPRRPDAIGWTETVQRPSSPGRGARAARSPRPRCTGDA